MSGVETTVLIGTTKGAFLLQRDTSGDPWTIDGPYCDGWPINHFASDPEKGTIWAGGGSDWSGAGVWRSDDGGKTWEVTRLTRGELDNWAANDPDFAEMIGWTNEPLPFEDGFSQVWSLHYTDGTLYAGTKPANLLKSSDDGKTWESLRSLSEHETVDSWNPGAAGLTLHTIISDPGNPKNSGSAYRRLVSLHPKTAARPGSGATGCPTYKTAAITIIPQHLAMARPGTVCII